jgi:signal transduction histidine kinase
VAVARQGFPSASRLYRSGRDYQKSAHAPVLNARGEIVGVLSVEADADFFDALGSLRRGAVITGVSVLVFLLVMAFLLGHLLRSVMQYRTSILRQQNLAAMGRMTAGIAHEIRNPLGIIRGAGELQANRLKEAGIDMPTSDFIQEEVDRLDRILSRYLAFGKGGGVELESLELDSLIRRVVRNLKAELAGTGVTVRIEADAKLPKIQGDSPGLQQVLLNLLFNARDEMPEGGEILIELKGRARNLQLLIHDQGRGLRGQQSEVLFEPFHTGKEKGSGLGLAVVRQVIEDHGGNVKLEDRRDGHGAVATITLPIEGV